MEEQPVETTLYSLSEAAPSPANRREGERLLTLYRVGSIIIGGRRELCLIKNISAGGMMIRAYCDVACDTRVSVELKSGHPIEGAVSWVRDSSAGITFDAPVDVIDLLSASMDGPRPRMPRIEVDCFATVRDGANMLRMRVRDVSQGGMKLESATQSSPGAPTSSFRCPASIRNHAWFAGMKRALPGSPSTACWRCRCWLHGWNSNDRRCARPAKSSS